MTDAGALLAASLGVPVAMLAACVSPRQRARMPALLAIAPLPALVAALLAPSGILVLAPAPLRLTLTLDVPGAILLGVAALLWVTAGLYASAYLRGDAHAGRFAVWWLLTLTGSLGTFIAADLVSFYLVFAMVSLAAYGLVVHEGTPRARRAGAIYVSLAVLGEALLLMGFVLLAAAIPGNSLLIRDAVAALPASPWHYSTVLLLILGFGLKLGLVPLHVWMPVAHPAAPIPASAVLSGVVVKAGVIGLIRFLPFETALPDWGGALAAAGLFTAFYAVAVGITQTNPKTVLAYSTVSQMGVIATVLGMGLAGGNDGAVLGVSFYAAHHILVKGALFLAVGVVQVTGARRLWPVLLPAAVLALSLGGLPLTGGALAKLAVKAPLGDGIVGLLATLSAAGTTLLMLHFLGRLVSTAAQDAEGAAPVRLGVPWLATALAAIAVPWALYLALGSGTFADVLAPAALWEAGWPVLVGGVLAVALWRWGNRLPRIPEGDVVVLANGASGVARASGDALERLDALLQQWPVAGLTLLALAILMGAAMLAGG
jgi:formate hydrogenlyase subunit 3/multisubunit Na+/H+ antiporter MnhD subunit